MKNILATLAFFVKHHGLHSFANWDKGTDNAIKSLEKRNYLKVDWNTKQAEYTGKVFCDSTEDEKIY